MPMVEMQRLVVGIGKTSKGHNTLRVIGTAKGDVGMVDDFIWWDGTDIFQVSTARIRQLQVPSLDPLHFCVLKWEQELGIVLEAKKLWRSIWLSYWAMAEAHFLWQVAFHVPATNHWRFWGLSRDHPDTMCERCEVQHEDILHCLWLCPEAACIW